MLRWRCGCGRDRLEELVGQEHVLGEGSALRTAIESGHPHSAILYGPPGSGKTTLARIAAAGADGAFEEESAVNAGKAEIKAVIERARERRAGSGRRDGPLPRRDPPLQQGPAGRAAAGGRGGAADPDRGDHREPLLRGQLGAALALPGLRAAPARARAGARRCCAGRSPTPSAASPTRPRSRTRRWRCSPSAPAATPGSRSRRSSGRSSAPARATVDVAAVEDALQRKAVDYDRQGDRHYDFISAWIKATRGSDVDASLYYLAVMLEGGEDPRFIARRMVILASEDIGNADPQALLVADAAARAVDRVGLPECALNLAQACVYLALAPKSNASDKGARRRPGGGPRATAPRLRPTICATPTTRAPGSSAAARATATRTTSPTASAISSCSRRASRARRFYAPTDRGFEAELGRPPRAAQGSVREKLTPAQLPQIRRVLRAAFQARARESRHTGRRPGLGASGRT